MDKESGMKIGKGGLQLGKKMPDYEIPLDKIVYILNLYILVYLTSCIYAISSTPSIASLI
ncbi:MAG: hypothetical protein U9Q22_04965 [Candidatus Altiarchaeota archaeon]|nr:hypothetical protein [Candidatus Altiarchaeota archaeon]